MTVYLLSELLWVSTREAGEVRYQRMTETGFRPVRLYLDPTKAEEERLRRERLARIDKTPFLYGSTLDEWTSLAPCPLYDWILETGLEPLPSLKPTQAECLAWWRRESEEMSESQRDRVWEALDRVRFFVVFEEEI